MRRSTRNKLGYGIAATAMVMAFQNCSPQGFELSQDMSASLNTGASTGTSPTPSPSPTTTVSPSPTATATPTATVSPTPTVSPSPTATATVTVTPSPTPTATASPTPTTSPTVAPVGYGSAITAIKNVLLDGDSNTYNGGVTPKLQSTINNTALEASAIYGKTLSIDIVGYAGANLQSMSRFNWANARANGAMNLVENWAVIGSLVGHVKADAPHGIKLPIDTVILAGGTNNFQIPDANVTQATADQVYNDMIAAIDIYTAAGKNVIVETVPAYGAAAGSGYNAPGPNHKKWMAYYNQKLIAAAYARTRVLVNDVNAVMGPQDANGVPTTPGLLATDGIHLSAKYGRLAGDQLYDVIKKYIAADSSYHVTSSNDNRATTASSSQLIPNPLMEGTGGKMAVGAIGTGLVPNGFMWDGVGDYQRPLPISATGSIETRVDGYGKDAVMTVQAGSGGASMTFQVTNLNPAHFVSGKTYYAEAFVELSNMSGVTDAYLTTGLSGGGTYMQRQFLGTANGSDGKPHSYENKDFKGVYRTEKMRPAGSVTGPFVHFKVFLAANGKATIKIGRMAIVEGTP